ncbi:F-box/LRR-repeat protein At4g14096-like isoform X2 [Vigna unguiculata]|uniref:F-box/LRR-repeat protein At4g14096-like isoform X2 n=1 Tax=Vigna unguiculata TaxID=3917 RepID=UPI001015E707|nr:F-box/LRR-repeat protein At4g14096-like isoform X2 [Vigna unguiculata]
MAEPSAKILRRTLDEALDGEADNIDRLSALPESVLLHILSGLELKEAAATSVLSTTWRDLFLQRPNIELAFDIYGNPSDRSRLFHIFTLFANRVLRQRNPEAPITSLKVSVKDFTKRMEEDYRSLLMSAAAAVYTYKVQQFDVDLGTYNLSTETSSIVLPPAMFTSETLTRLLLTLSVGWDVPENVWLPNLRYAHFIPYRLMHEDSIQRFLDGCPSLETLMFLMRVTTEDETEVKTLCISSSSLKLLMVDWDMIDETEMNITVKSESLERLTLYLKGGHNVNVDAPNLNFFSISGQVLDLNIIQGLPSINEAVLDVAYTFQVSDLNEFFTRSEKVCTFFRELQNLTLLSISEPIMEALYDSTMAMPTFRNMYKIKLIPDYSDDFPRERMQHVLFNLLESCPKLQVLSFERIMRSRNGIQAD